MSKKMFVAIKQVPDTETRIRPNPEGKDIDRNGLKWIVNPYDEFAIEEAIKWKSSHPDSTTFVVSVGPKNRVTEALRTALAMGIDEAIVVDAPEGFLSPQMVAKTIAQVIQKEGGANYILTGKVAIDDNLGLVPPMIAHTLSLPFVGFASKIDWKEGFISVTRNLEGGFKENLEIQGAAVISCDKGLNQPRYPSLPGIMKAKKKPIKELTLSDLGVHADFLQINKVTPPPERPAPKILSGTIDEQVRELVRLLKEEAKVL